ncbi:MAG: peptidyl-prolyl cis-trans isomerase [Balneolaceae bacterium]
MTCNRLFFATLILFTAACGCEQFQDDSEDPVLAVVGDQQLTLSSAVSNIPEGILRQDTITAIRNYQSSWIEDNVLIMEARRLGLDTNQELVNRLERLKSQLMLNVLKEVILSEHRDELEVTSEEAGNYYQANRDRFILEETYVRFRHMTANTRTDADNARRAIMNGTSWPDVAQRYSMDPERQIRESERFIPVSMAVPDLPRMQNYLEIIGITEISPVLSANGVYHFIQLMEERPAGDYPDLDWLIEQIKEWLYLEKSERLINSYKRNLYLQGEANDEIERTDIGSLENSVILNVLQNEEN